ncbi:MAG: ABC transporter permease, partial [Pseudomonadota bacterium]
MAEVTQDAPSRAKESAATARPTRRVRAYSVRTLPGFAAVALFTFVALYAPIFILVIYSFNEGRSLAIWEGF